MRSVGEDVVEQVQLVAGAQGGSDRVTSDSDVVVIQKFVEDAEVLSANDASMYVAEMRGYIGVIVAR